jgi:hypothetical protein
MAILEMRTVDSDSGGMAVPSCSREDTPLLQAAKLLVEPYGAGAAKYTARRAGLLQRKGDVLGATGEDRAADLSGGGSAELGNASRASERKSWPRPSEDCK